MPGQAICDTFCPQILACTGFTSCSRHLPRTLTLPRSFDAWQSQSPGENGFRRHCHLADILEKVWGVVQTHFKPLLVAPHKGENCLKYVEGCKETSPCGLPRDSFTRCWVPLSVNVRGNTLRGNTLRGNTLRGNTLRGNIYSYQE